MNLIRRELRPMLRIALPLVLAEVGWMVMSLVDTAIVGHLPNPAVPLSASSLAEVIYNTFAFGIGGMLLGLDTMISQAHGAKDYPQANRWFWQGVLLCAALAVVLMLIFAAMPAALLHLPTDQTTLAGAIPTLKALSWGTLPLLLYFTLRRYLQSFNHVRVIAAALISANLINLLFDWLLVFGHDWRLGGLHVAWSGGGVVGSGIATSLARTYMALFCLVALVRFDRRNGYGLFRQFSLGPHWASLRRLLALGLPTGASIFVEILVFATITAIIATLGPVPLAGHEIALNCISFTFMIPLGIASAASIRVGQAIGRGSLADARAAGWAGIALGVCAMGCSSLLYLSAPHLVAVAFTADVPVITATVPLLGIAALFQFCDGLQVTAIGALRGAGDTLTGFVTHLCSYWLLGLPLGIFLCFHEGLGARGLWLGLSGALIVTGIVMLLRWRSVIRTLHPAPQR